MRLPFSGSFPVTRGYIKFDPSMPLGLQDPVYGKTHRGIDYALPVGTRLVAAISGTVTAAGFSPDGAGIIVVIRSGNLYVKCFHMSIVSVNVGQFVQEGQPIGASGTSGSSTGPHLHLQVEEGLGNAVDPARYLNVTDVKEVPMPNEGDIHNAYLEINGRKATPDEIKTYVSKPFSAPDGLFYGKTVVDIRNMQKELKKLRGERDNATDIANIRAEQLETLAKKLGGKYMDFGALLDAVQPPSNAEKKLEQIKEIVKE